MNTTLLSIDQVRDAFGDFLQTSYRSRRERVALTRTLDRIDQTALVFTDAHAQCLLVRVTDDARTHHVVGSGQRLCCVDPRTLVVAPHRAWLQLTPSKPAATP
ncbi:MAG TPA: hypothetical protein VFX59_15335 [Polyangiales bacterium]|nr:hypothetical protein [Polyangiales bacterium]